MRHMLDMLEELGLSEIASSSPAFESDEWQGERDRLEASIAALQSENTDCRQAMETARQAELTAMRKLNEFQQLSKSQTLLVKTELHKTRVKLRNAKRLATFYKGQVDWVRERQPGVFDQDMPSELRDLPEEEPEEPPSRQTDGMAALLSSPLGPLTPPPTPFPHAASLQSCSPSSQSQHSPHSDYQALVDKIRTEIREIEVPELTQKLQEAQDKVDTFKRHIKKQASELDKLRSKLSSSASASTLAPSSFSPSASPSAQSDATNGLPGDYENGSGDDDTQAMQLRKSLDKAHKELQDCRAEYKAREGELVKKLKQLAQAYQALQKKNKCLEEQSSVSRGEKAAHLQSLRALLQRHRQLLLSLKDAVRQEVSSLREWMEPYLLARLPSLVAAAEADRRAVYAKFAKEAQLRRKLHNLVQELRGNIRVYCRVRPLLRNEANSCITFPGDDEIRITNDVTGQKKTWRFDKIFAHEATQQELFDEVQALVVSCLDGYNVCIFAYGQTGSGKTHSMQGTAEDPGIYHRTFRELFNVIHDRRGDWRYKLQTSMIEIYNDEIQDLLIDANDTRPPRKLAIRTGPQGNYVPDLVIWPVNTPEEVQNALNTGTQNRSVGCTNLNEHSSRSHLILSVYCDITTPNHTQYQSRLHLVDLAGSERLKKSGATDERAKEAMFINRSLTSLGDVIAARAAKTPHVPYRNSTLTYLLQDALGGDSKTLMLLQINPSDDAFEESLCSLQFAARVNNVEMTVEKRK
ncbi:unnamed protein product [Vitrella brassicaformis CCMP3155]|uniref:Kinesin-like protein n=1 Tax=Vitrella brassicaformis (strain CCMP3155) TaxID=1169540 RepID=A0A0G4EZY6_VITBC|nr:unnamed protein product [Vitrella brassicaformis CCMP3155]|eukprot:CEM05202.1 unnamed protein product [Vitrella brassicaformis CCMP3155]